MPTIPLYSHATDPDGWHQVTSPGGYEWWNFNAYDASTDRLILARFAQGLTFHPEYQRRYHRYRRWPTRVKPPAPRDFCGVSCTIIRGGIIETDSMREYAPSEFEARADAAHVCIGPNQLHRRDSDGALVVSIDGQTPLTFTPRIAQRAAERALLGESRDDALHRWIVANPLCDVQGDAFQGLGYHDHFYGTAPIGGGLARWFLGNVFDESGASCAAFQVMQPLDPRADDEVHLIEADQTGVRECEVDRVEMDWDWSRRSIFLLKYPMAIRFGDALRLSNPRAAVSSPYNMLLTYDADHRGRRGRAVCELIYPRRLRWWQI